MPRQFHEGVKGRSEAQKPGVKGAPPPAMMSIPYLLPFGPHPMVYLKARLLIYPHIVEPRRIFGEEDLHFTFRVGS